MKASLQRTKDRRIIKYNPFKNKRHRRSLARRATTHEELKEMATNTTQSGLSVSVEEFNNDPNEVLRSLNDQAVAIISHNKPLFYIVPAIRYQAMLEEIDGLRLVRVVSERLKQKELAIEVTLDEL
jgi:antitoxin StbD